MEHGFLDSIWWDVTRLGESGFLLPVGVLLFLWLSARKLSRLAILWAVTFGIGVAVVLGSKLAFLGWGIGIASLNFTGFSGHTMLATAVFPTLAWLCCVNARPAWRYMAIVLGVGLAIAVGFSRLALQAHSVSEVVLGFLVGLAVALTFIGLAHAQSRARIPLWLAAIVLVASSFVHVERYAPSRGVIVALALAVSGHQHIYRRDRWLAHPDEEPS